MKGLAKGLAANDNTTPSPVFRGPASFELLRLDAGLLMDSDAFRHPRRDLRLCSVVLPRAAALRAGFLAAEPRPDRAGATFFRLPAFGAAFRFPAGGLAAAFLRVGFFTGAISSTASMAPATSDTGAMPLTDFTAPCQPQ